MPINLLAERDRLDHQRSRIQEILAAGMVSTEMADHLRQRLTHISQRLVQLAPSAQLPPPHASSAVPQYTA